MHRALAEARKGWGQTAPNPMVGAVIVRSGEIVGVGHHTRFGAPHAEVEALRAASERAVGATVYATLEPCAHTGKTPPCVDALIAAGVSRVVVAARDPNPEAAGGVERLRAAGIAVDVGVVEPEAREL
ncbi:MAG: bifunctional diaminohydroxyphosphoribosylaminopyrimidine deaminase/5-amino-6-(5-phosphoribosylamino)uracil reductase RibD, partial [Gemmatimonadaceae bacterium]